MKIYADNLVITCDEILDELKSSFKASNKTRDCFLSTIFLFIICLWILIITSYYFLSKK